MMDEKTASLRREYSSKSLLETEADADPVRQFSAWWSDALAANLAEPNAMTLATATTDGIPSARIVLLKGFSSDGFLFFTNYESFKGQVLAENPKACLVFFWKELERQVRITGLVQKVAAAESDAYFQSRPHVSQLGAIVSPQSRVIENREWLDARFTKLSAELPLGTTKRPANWGGYLVKPVIMEFWQGRPGRMHDRLQYSLVDDGTWKMERLAP
jgi:pyridoxamine 5'-phosphate oxidase